MRKLLPRNKTVPRTDELGLNRWHEFSGKPVLLADGARQIAGEGDTKRHDPVGYEETHAALREVKSCVGFHLCGAYLRNNSRKRGLRDAAERPDENAIAGITATNRKTARWVKDFGWRQPG